MTLVHKEHISSHRRIYTIRSTEFLIDAGTIICMFEIGLYLCCE